MSRHIMRIELDGEAKQMLAEFSDRSGMTQVAIMSRLVTWFTTQPEMIQSLVLHRIPEEIEADVAKLILHRLAEGA